MMRGSSFTQKRRYHGVSKSQLICGDASWSEWCGRGPADRLSATNIRSETTATAVGSPPAPAPRKAISPLYSPEVKTRFKLRCTRPNGDEAGTRLGPTSANKVVPSKPAREI